MKNCLFVGSLFLLLSLSHVAYGKSFFWGMFLPAINVQPVPAINVQPVKCNGSHVDLCKDKKSCTEAGLIWNTHFNVCTNTNTATHQIVGAWVDQYNEAYLHYYPDGTYYGKEFVSTWTGYWVPLSTDKVARDDLNTIITIIDDSTYTKTYNNSSDLTYYYRLTYEFP